MNEITFWSAWKIIIKEWRWKSLLEWQTWKSQLQGFAIFAVGYALLYAASLIPVSLIKQGPALYKKWTMPVHDRAFTIAVDNNQPSDACAEAGAAAGAYLLEGDAEKYRLWKANQQTWCGVARPDAQSAAQPAAATPPLKNPYR